jgi:HSP20 family protein
MRELVEHLLSDFKESFIRDTIMWRPATDVYETETEFVVRMDLAGIGKEDISVVLETDKLIVRGIRKDSIPPGKKHFHKMEIVVGPFERCIPVPQNCDREDVAAVYKEGFLEVRLRKIKGHTDREVRIEVE